MILENYVAFFYSVNDNSLSIKIFIFFKSLFPCIDLLYSFYDLYSPK